MGVSGGLMVIWAASEWMGPAPVLTGRGACCTAIRYSYHLLGH